MRLERERQQPTTRIGDDSGSRVRILIISNQAFSRDSLVRFLEGQQEFAVVAGCNSAIEALDVLKSRSVDMILLDLDLGLERAVEFLGRLQKESFGGKVLLVTTKVDESEVPKLIRKGISGIFMKHAPPALLIRGICEAMEGRVLFDRDLLRRGIESAEQPALRHAPVRLTERERRVLSFVFDGLTNKEIANRLQLSESAVKACLQQLFGKTGVRTRSQLVRIVLEQHRDQL